jgi:hypothetical protein
MYERVQMKVDNIDYYTFGVEVQRDLSSTENTKKINK